MEINLPLTFETIHHHSRINTAVRSLLLAGLLAASTALLTRVQASEAQADVKQNIYRAELTESLAAAELFREFGNLTKDRSFNSDALFFETLLSYGPVDDPRPVLLLVNTYITTNQQEIGIRFFEKLLATYRLTMTDQQAATYLSAYALLRATHAEQVFLLSRIGWVTDTFNLLEEARAAGGDTNPIVRWASGLIYAQVPWFFGKQDAALEELTWLAEHPETEPEPGFYREAYRFLAKIHKDRGDPKLAADFLRKSGYQDGEPSVLFMGWFSSTKEKGLLFSPMPWIEQIIPGRVFAARGFGFSDIHFVLSEDRKELVVVDAGTQPFSMKAAYTYLMEKFPTLPPITSAFITHAHWDHIGGYTALKAINPNILIYGRENYQTTLNRVRRNHTYKQFRSAGYSDDWVKDYAPDVKVSTLNTVIIGGTAFELIPAVGGETEDNMLIHTPALKTTFVGDTLMPFYGEPWVEEGYIDQAIETMDEVIRRQPDHVLHGHYALTYLYDAAKLPAFRDAYAWLVTEARKHIVNGYSVKEIVRLNLIPPLLKDHPEAMISYAAPRNHIIARVADHMVGIWQENKTGKEPAGLDTITAVEYGRMMHSYFGLSEGQVVRGLDKMLKGGDIELALQMAVAAELSFPESQPIAELRIRAADLLRGSYQFLDPFKFVVYTEIAGREHHPVEAPTNPRE